MLLDDIQGVRVLVVGDVMLDHFVVGRVERVSPEAAALVLSVDRTDSMLGGAGNVAANVASLGGVAVVVGVIGADVDGAVVANIVADFHGSVIDALVSSTTTRTTSKTRFIAGERHLLRADSGSVGLSQRDEEAVSAAMRRHARGCDVIVVSDYAKGVVTPSVMQTAVHLAAECGVPLVADPKRRDLALYAGASLLTPNVSELAFATGEPCDSPLSRERAAHAVMAATGSAVLLTRSEDGVALYREGADAWTDGPHAGVVRDVSGAGDTVLAVSAGALAAGADLVEASHLANVAAGLAVAKAGTSCVSADELTLALLQAPDAAALSGKLLSTNSAVRIRRRWRDEELTVGFTNGCFDLLHPGHIKLLAEASQLCDRLIVALNTDASIRRLKGSERPIQTELARAEIIGALRVVDVVVLFDDDTPSELIALLQPQLLIKGSDYTEETVVGAELVRSWGGRVALIDLAPGESSSRLIAISRGVTPGNRHE